MKSPIRFTATTLPKIRNTNATLPRLDASEVARALGAELTLESVQQDPLALSIAHALFLANRAAIAEGIVPVDSSITINDEISDAGETWCIHYGPRKNVNQRGGDPMAYVDQQTGEIRKIVHGQ